MNSWQIIIIGILVFLNLCIIIVLIGAFIGLSFGSPFVPSKNQAVKKMLKLANIKSGERVFDLGCGDGRIVFAAEKKGAICTGIEISPPVYLFAYLKKIIQRKKSEIRFGNFFYQKDLVDADVIFLFLLPETMQKFANEIFPKLKNGTRIISHAFNIKKLKAKKILSRIETGHAPIFLFVK